MKRLVMTSALIALVLGSSACNTVSKVINPYYEPPNDVALEGELSDRALNGNEEKLDTARQAFDYAATYQRSHLPQPNKPVMEPAVVRLLWIPDHLNDKNDLVPAHYYYLKVRSERWGVTDAFEKEAQLGPNIDAGAVPYINEGNDVAR